MKAHLKKIVPSLAEIRKRFPVVSLLSWGNLLRDAPPSQKQDAVYGHLVALPFEEKMKSVIRQTVSEEEARDLIRSRMTKFFHKLRIHHSAVRDVTLLCGWWRLDAHDSPEYNDMQHKLVEAQKPVPLTHSEEFLKRTRTFDVSEGVNSFERGTDAVAYSHAKKLFDQECIMCGKYAAFQMKSVSAHLPPKAQHRKSKSKVLGMSEGELRQRVEKYMVEMETESRRKLQEKAEQTAKDAELLM